MTSSVILVTAPAKLPVSLGELKAYTRIQNDREDALLHSWLLSAIDDAQQQTGRQLITSTWEEIFDDWPSSLDRKGERSLELRWAPVQSVTSVKYLDENGAEQTLNAADYRLDQTSMRARVVFDRDVSLPSLADRSQTITVRHVAGYGTEPHDVPEPIRHWIMLQVATRDAFREMFADRAPSALPRAYTDGLLDHYRREFL